ncbi:hypothetical protein [Snodgrassella alvi]
MYVHPFAKYLLIDNPASHLTLPFNNKRNRKPTQPDY